MKFLIDMTVLIPAHPADPVLAELIRLLAQGRHQVYVHPASLQEMRRNPAQSQQRMQDLPLRKYVLLPRSPAVSERLASALAPSASDGAGLQLLAAVEGDAVDFLVTEDRHLRAQARQAGLHRRVATPSEAIGVLEALFPSAPPAAPAVHTLAASELDEADPIFAGRREDGTGFDWRRGKGQAWALDGEGGRYGGVCLARRQKASGGSLPGQTLRIGFFQVAGHDPGQRRAEMLLQAVLSHAFRQGLDHVAVPALLQPGDLGDLFADLGFRPLERRAARGEALLAKPLRFSPAEYDSCDPLAFNARYGPYHVKTTGVPAFVVPLPPRCHRLLLPEAEQQLPLLPDRNPFGNSIRKAYLSHATIRRIVPGSVLLFYRTGDQRAVTALGVAEGTLVSSDPSAIARFAGQRSIYTFAEIEALCQRPVLAILFRLARPLEEPIPLASLLHSGALRAAPRSIVTVHREAADWLRARLEPPAGRA